MPLEYGVVLGESGDLNPSEVDEDGDMEPEDDLQEQHIDSNVMRGSSLVEQVPLAPQGGEVLQAESHRADQMTIPNDQSGKFVPVAPVASPLQLSQDSFMADIIREVSAYEDLPRAPVLAPLPFPLPEVPMPHGEFIYPHAVSLTHPCILCNYLHSHPRVFADEMARERYYGVMHHQHGATPTGRVTQLFVQLLLPPLHPAEPRRECRDPQEESK